MIIVGFWALKWSSMLLFFPTAAKEEEFTCRSEHILDELESYPQVSTYIESQWLPYGHMWANYGRRFQHDNSETNNIAERWASNDDSFP